MEPVTTRALQAFLKELGERYTRHGTFYLQGGSPRETRDVDYMAEPAPDADPEVKSALDALGTELKLDLRDAAR